ncbi:MAG: AMP-binding protein [Desulfobacteraceae bacterium]|nr:AMP-binding protein [Desulfobacteraceae bacterium]
MRSIPVKPWTKIPDYFSSQEMSTAVLAFDHSKCKKCDICTFICPARSIARDSETGAWNNGFPYLKSMIPGLTDCIACGCCLAACPVAAISIVRNFNAGHFYQRLTQTSELVRPRCYRPSDAPSATPPPRPSSTPAALPAQKIGGTPAAPPLPKGRALRQIINRLKLTGRMLRGATAFAIHQIQLGRGWRTLKKFAFGTPFDISWAQLLEESARQVPEKKCLLYNQEVFSYRQMDENANRMGNYFLGRAVKGKGVGLLLRNSPRFLDLFFGAQKVGMYLVPINPELRGDGLVYIVNHSDIATLVVDVELLEQAQESLGLFERLKAQDILVNDLEIEAQGIPLPPEMPRLSQAYQYPAFKPTGGYHPEEISLIIYTSGTTGRPKGVVYRYNTTGVQLLALGGNVFFNSNDIYYTYLSLCHGNALFITVTMSLAVQCTIALSRKFSASRFWETVRQYDATVFNTIGTIIPILMKQPPTPADRQHRVRIVFSAACPLEMWEPFEKRFGVELYEGYGAVDGGGKGIMNLGTAPPGSLGKPTRRSSIRIVDENDRDVPDGMPGELLFKISTRRSLVEYYKNPQATEKKSSDGWLRTGDIVKRDAKGYLYFVGRNTESMRKGGENVSAYEVEHVIMQHPAVEDAAVYAVPSELGEDEIMAAVKPVEGKTIEAADLRRFLSDKLAKFAVPRYVRIVADFPKTSTHRVIKQALAQEGVTADTYDGRGEGA